VIQKLEYFIVYRTTIVVHDRDWAENFQNSLIECTGKAAFQVANLSLNPSRPLLSVLKDEKYFTHWKWI